MSTLSLRDLGRQTTGRTAGALTLREAIRHPGRAQRALRPLLDRLGAPTECWTALGNAVDSGPTEIRDSSFYADPDDRPTEDQRLDYVLLEPGSAAIPLVAATEILRFEHNGHYISDHYGITSRFDTVAVVA